ncbi:helix-turn-helix domain-containing protein [Pedobacter cryoconitis]|nr:AraC family transcriptional regulator [Pedobacter cryoconitis]
MISKNENISEIAYALGFENLSYFSRLFKKEAGVSPNSFKKQMTN